MGGHCRQSEGIRGMTFVLCQRLPPPSASATPYGFQEQLAPWSHQSGSGGSPQLMPASRCCSSVNGPFSNPLYLTLRWLPELDHTFPKGMKIPKKPSYVGIRRCMSRHRKIWKSTSSPWNGRGRKRSNFFLLTVYTYYLIPFLIESCTAL